MADEKIVFKVVADYDKAIKEWEQLRDKVADTTQEYQEAQKEIESLKRAKAELTGETIKSNKAFKKETQAQRESTSEYKKRKKDLEIAFDKQQEFNDVVGTSSVLSFKNSINATKKEISALIKLRNTLDITGDEFVVVSNKIALLEQRLKTSSKGNSGSLGTFNKGLKGVSKASGGATAATLELGRAISDAPYGIRGVANNLSQFASQFSFMANKVDETTGKVVGFNGAIKNLGKAIRANAVLLAIQLVIAALDHFSGSAKKAEESASNYEASLRGLQKTLSSLYTTQGDVNEKFEEYSKLAELKRKTDALVRDESEKLSKLNEKIAKQESFIASLGSTEGRQKVLNKLLEDRRAIYNKTTNAITILKKATEDFNSAKEGTVKALEKEKSKLVNQQKTLSSTSEKWEEYAKKIKDKQKEIDLITGGKNKDKTISPFKTKEALDLDVKNSLTAQQKLQRQTELINLKTEEKLYLNSVQSEEDKLAYKEFYAQKRLEIELDYELKGIDAKEAAEKASVRKKAIIRIKELEDDLVKYKKNLKDKGTADTAAGKESIAKATKEVEEKVALTKTEAERTVQQITEEYAKLFPFWAQMADAKRNALGVGSTDDSSGGGKYSGELEGVAFYVEQYTQLMSGIGDFLQAEADRELTIEQNKTNVLNEELNKRLLNENLSENERKSIQDQILKNDEDLRVKQNKIKKKAFDTQKALNISMAIANTIAAGISAANQSYGGAFAKIAAMTAVIGAGMAQVAIIARQKFQPDSPNTPINTGGGGTSGGTTQRAEPSFNIVGGSRENQLLTAIQSQFDKPLKAYVVSTEVTDQQQLDSVIVNTAGT